MVQLLALLILFNIRPLMMAFGAEPEVVAFGVAQARIATPFYFLPAMSHCMAGILRGLGKAVVPMLVMLVCWCLIRVGYPPALRRLSHHLGAERGNAADLLPASPMGRAGTGLIPLLDQKAEHGGAFFVPRGRSQIIRLTIIYFAWIICIFCFST